MSTTWTIAVDWDRTGSFDDLYDDVTSKVMGASWFLGERKPYQTTADDSTMTLTLANSDRRFSPENSSSPLSGKLTPFKPVRIQSDDGTTTRTHWIGWITSLQPTVNQFGERTVEIKAAGPMQFYKAAETNLALQENMRTDNIIGALIEEVVIPPALTGAWFVGRVRNSELGATTWLASTAHYSDLDEGFITLSIAADNWVQRGGSNDRGKDTFDVYRAIKDVTAAEQGRFLFGRDGKAIFWNRHHLDQGLPASIPEFDDTMTGLEYLYAGADNNFKNEVTVVCHPRAIGTSDQEILWQLDKEIRIPAGDSRTVSAKFQDASDNRIGGKDVTVTDVTFSEGDASYILDVRANSASLEFTNDSAQDAILSSCIVRGKKITDFGRMEAMMTDSASIADYGRRTLRINLPSVDNYEDARSIAQFEVHRRSQPAGMVGSMTLKSHGAQGGNQHDQQLARTLGDMVAISETQTSHSNNYHIIGEMHRLAAGAAQYETTWYLEPAPQTYPWKLGVTDRSELGDTTVLSYGQYLVPPYKGDTATGTIMFSANPSANDTITIDEAVFTFVSSLSGAGDILIGTAKESTAANLIAAINGDPGNGTIYQEPNAIPRVTATLNGSVVTLAALSHGTWGNAIEYSTDASVLDLFGNPSVLSDGDMEDSDTSVWTAINSALLSKQTVSPHGGTRCLRVQENGTTNPYCFEANVTEIGKSYLITGWARSDGTAIPKVYLNGTLIWSGTTSTAWQYFNVISTNDGLSGPSLQAVTGAGTSNYCEFDDIRVVEIVNLLTDGDMEDTSTSAWTFGAATIGSKQTTSPRGGSRLLRLAENGGTLVLGYENPVETTGKEYRVNGWARSDGSGIPTVVNYPGVTLWTGTTSTSWQNFCADYVSLSTLSPLLRGSVASGSGQYVEFDDVCLTPMFNTLSGGTDGPI